MSPELEEICKYVKEPREAVVELVVSQAIWDELCLWLGEERTKVEKFSLEDMPIVLDKNFARDMWMERYGGYKVGFRVHRKEIMRTKTLGNIGYDAYCKFTNNKSLVSGADLPTFDHLQVRIQEAWEKAGQAVAASVGRAGEIVGHADEPSPEPETGSTTIVK
jgi:hypothetical protein